MSDTPISEKEIEFAMAMFAACNPNRTGHLCKAMRMLERELNRSKGAWHTVCDERDQLKSKLIRLEDELAKAKRLLEIPRPQNDLIAMERERDEWKACAEGKMQSPTWPHVLSFALRMEAKLEANRHKGNREGWLKDHPWDLVERLLDETVEVQQCFTSIGGLSCTPEETANECADVANFCMMVADNITNFNILKAKSK